MAEVAEIYKDPVKLQAEQAAVESERKSIAVSMQAFLLKNADVTSVPQGAFMTCMCIWYCDMRKAHGYWYVL